MIDLIFLINLKDEMKRVYLLLKIDIVVHQIFQKYFSLKHAFK